YKPAGHAGESSEEVPFAVVLASPFQINVMNAFGRQMLHLEGTGSTNKNGFWMASLLAVDEYNNGVPVGILITSSEAADVHSDFL
ncbi:hypothetical protein COO60DRAFT_1252240, partial [Scenedesmus sp. NREL 46B-D3]